MGNTLNAKQAAKDEIAAHVKRLHTAPNWNGDNVNYLIVKAESIKFLLDRLKKDGFSAKMRDDISQNTTYRALRELILNPNEHEALRYVALKGLVSQRGANDMLMIDVLESNKSHPDKHTTVLALQTLMLRR